MQPNPLVNQQRDAARVREDHDRSRRHGSRGAGDPRAEPATRIGRPQPSLPAAQPGELHAGVARSPALPRADRSQVGRVRGPQHLGGRPRRRPAAARGCPRRSSTRTRASSRRCGIASSAPRSAIAQDRDANGNATTRSAINDDGWKRRQTLGSLSVFRGKRRLRVLSARPVLRERALAQARREAPGRSVRIHLAIPGQRRRPSKRRCRSAWYPR